MENKKGAMGESSQNSAYICWILVGIFGKVAPHVSQLWVYQMSCSPEYLKMVNHLMLLIFLTGCVDEYCSSALKCFILMRSYPEGILHLAMPYG